MRSVFALVEAQVLLLTLVIFVGLGPVPQTVIAYPTGTTPFTISNSETTATDSPPPASNETLLSSSGTDDTTGELTEYPVFISVPEEETQTISPAIVSDSSVILADGESDNQDDAVTEGYGFIEDQEVDDDDDHDGSDSSTVSSAIVRTTLPMRSPKSSREQEEVLRELKKLWDLSEGLSDSGNDAALRSSLSSIIYLAYARVYSESGETLLKLKDLLQKLQARILGTEANGDERFSTTSTPSSSPISFGSSTPYGVLTSEPNYASSVASNEGSSPANLMRKGFNNEPSGSQHDRKRRSYSEDVEAIFFANVDSQENSVIPDEKHYYKLNQNQSRDEDDISHMNGDENGEKYNVADSMAALTSQLLNGSDGRGGEPLDRTLLQLGAISSSTTASSATILSVSSLGPVVVATTPSTTVQKVVHINDRKKPMTSFYLSPERIQELKDRMKTTTFLPPPPPLPTTASKPKSTSTLSPISIAIQDEVENEVNSLQQQGQVENYDVHISENFPSVTTSPSNEHKRPGSTTMPSLSLSTSPFSAEDIALALFQLLRPDALDDNNEIENNHEPVKVTMHHLRPTPPTPTVLYQMGALSSRLNFTLSKPLNGSWVTLAPATAPVISQSTSSSTTEKTTTLSTSTTTTSTTTTKPPPPSTISPSVLSVLKLKDILRRNTTLLDIPSELSNLGANLGTTTSRSVASTEKHNVYANDDVYDDYDPMPTKPPPTLLDGIRDTIAQTLWALARLSIGAKIVLIFSICISFLSIGFGLYALGPPLAGVGFLGIIIPVALLLLFETAAVPQSSMGNRKVDGSREEQLIEKVHSEEFSEILDMIFNAVRKYGKGERKMQF